MDKNRLLTDEEFIKLRPAFAGVDKIVLQAQDLKSVKAVIEDITEAKATCHYTSGNCGYKHCGEGKGNNFATLDCTWWQQFKERVLK